MTRGVFVGVDVSKDRLDVAFRPGGEKLIVPNDRSGTTRLVRTISRLTSIIFKLLPSAEGSEGLLKGCEVREARASPSKIDRYVK